MTRSQQMLGSDSNYVPGWDCHGLPIEWKIEEENYRSKGKAKPDLSDPAAMIAFRKECRAYAAHWLNVQREEFKRLGVVGDWEHPYTTMDFAAEAQIARELMKFRDNGLLYRGSKPVMWSVVEKTALAEAEVEYEDFTSDTVWVKFPVAGSGWGARVFDSPRCPSRRTHASPARRLRRDLDDDAVDAARQPRHQLLGEDQICALQGHRRRAGQLGEVRRPLHPVREPRRRGVQAGARHRLRKGRRPSGGAPRDARLRPSAESAWRLRFPGSPAGRRTRHRRYRHRLRAHGAGSRPGRLRHLDGEQAAARCSRRQHRDPLHRRCRRSFHRGRARLHRQARPHRQGREGRRQRRRDQGA